MKPYAFAGLLLAGTVFSGPAIAQFQTGIQQNSTYTTNNIANTSDDIARAYDNSTYRSQRRINDLLSGGGFSRQVNRVIDQGTNAVAGVVDDVVDDATDTVMAPIEDAVSAVGQTVSCNFIGAALAGAGSAINAVLTAGRATYGAQVAQYLSQTSSNLCQGKQLATAKLQLATERRMLIEQRRMNADGVTDNFQDLNNMMARELPGMAAGGFLMQEGDIANEYYQAYPAVFPPLTPDELIAANHQLAAQERQAHILSLQSQNRVVLEQAKSVERSRNYADEGRRGLGIRAELQAANAIGGEQVAALNSLTFATVASHRATTEVQLRQEAKQATANAAAEEYMSNLATCGNCRLSRPFLGS